MAYRGRARGERFMHDSGASRRGVEGVSGISKRRMGGAKRYPSIASYEDDGFRRLNPSYGLNLHWSFAASAKNSA